MFCVNCQRDVVPEIVTGADIYGPRFAIKDALYCRCPICGNYGEHGTPPYDVIPTFQLRRAYNYIDSILDLLWMQKKLSQSEVLYRMADLMYSRSKDYRTHDLATYDEACRAYRLAKKLKKEIFANDQTVA